MESVCREREGVFEIERERECVERKRERECAWREKER